MPPPKTTNGFSPWVDYFGSLFGAENDRLSWSVEDGRGGRKIVTAHFNDAATVIQVEFCARQRRFHDPCRRGRRLDVLRRRQ